MLNFIDGLWHGPFSTLDAGGLIRTSTDGVHWRDGMTMEQIARICHETNRAYCDALGDTTQIPWEQTTVQHRDSVTAGVSAIVNNKVKTPAQSHGQWLRRKMDEGWTFGEQKDPALKRSPCIVPYPKLPAEHKLKDVLFFAIASALAKDAF